MEWQLVDFLKIDTESHDLFVHQGYPWECGKPAVIECEFEDAKTVPLGYTFHRYLTTTSVNFETLTVSIYIPASLVSG
jgi:hypothetical protein